MSSTTTLEYKTLLETSFIRHRLGFFRNTIPKPVNKGDTVFHAEEHRSLKGSRSNVLVFQSAHFFKLHSFFFFFFFSVENYDTVNKIDKSFQSRSTDSKWKKGFHFVTYAFPKYNLLLFITIFKNKMPIRDTDLLSKGASGGYWTFLDAKWAKL